MGWTLAADNQGRTYYVNGDTGETTWEKPLELMTPLEVALARLGWREYTAEGGQVYYFNQDKGESSWVVPEGVQELVSAAEGLALGGPAPGELALEDKEVGGAQDSSAGQTDSEPVVDPHNILAPETPDAAAAYIELLRSAEVDATWPYSRVIAAFVDSPVYWLVGDARARRDLYTKYLATRSREELMRENQSKEQFTSAFVEVLGLIPGITHATRWTSAVVLLESEPIYVHAAIPEREKRAVFREYRRGLRRRHREEVEQLRQKALPQVPALVASTKLLLADTWLTVYGRVVATPEYASSKALQALAKRDWHEEYTRQMAVLVSAAQERVGRLEKQYLREDRVARDGFKQALQELLALGQVDVDSVWSDVYPLVQGDVRLEAMLGRRGLLPIDLLWDVVYRLDQELRVKRDVVLTLMVEHGVVAGGAEEFVRFLAAHQEDERLKRVGWGPGVDLGQAADVGRVHERLVKAGEKREAVAAAAPTAPDKRPRQSRALDY